MAHGNPGNPGFDPSLTGGVSAAEVRNMQSMITSNNPNIERSPVRDGSGFKLDELEPIVDRNEFTETTGLWGDLVLEINVGKHTSIGIVDRDSYQKAKGMTPSGVIWAGPHGPGQESMAFNAGESGLAAVLLQRDGEGKVDAVRDAYGKPQMHFLKAGIPLTVGRDVSKDIVTPRDASVSRNHAEILFVPEANSVAVLDKGSLNGTYTGAIRNKGTETAFDDDVTADYVQPTAKPHGRREDYVDVNGNYIGERPPRYFREGLAEKALKGEDASLVDREQGLYGVFDGAGGHGGASEASQGAAKKVGEIMKSLDPKAPSRQIEDTLRHALREGSEVAGHGVTTAVVVKIHHEGGKEYATWASVGDSRLYVYNTQSGRLKMISKDEGEGRYLDNCLGGDRGRNAKVKQVGTFELDAYDRLMLCSDGITGDYGSDILGDDEIRSVLHWAPSPEAASVQLVDMSRKRDDKTAIVIG